MQRIIRTLKANSLLAFALLALTALSGVEPTSVNAQQVSAAISTREAYVGSTITMQLRAVNAKSLSLPEGFEIDGCDVKAGSPQRSSQLTIINGRRSESSSVTMHYRITPRRQGTFEVPELEIEVDGKTQTTQTIPFVVTKSETGDLLFVEIEGKKESVYVGEPLELTLKLWVKPFQDRKNGIKLDESNMWQLLSDTTTWGPFSDRIQVLAENRQRPEGKAVLRDNGQGDSREYFLYQLKATVYPDKPGKIDGDDLQVVLNYPVEIGRRDRFESMFGGRSFGGNSLMKRMMDDDFFGRSPFGSRLTVTKSRPVTADVDVDTTTVLPIPSDGKPRDYRGAVGRYRIITQADTKAVDAGDPVTLRIGVLGDGRMDLVQAPPLSEVSELTTGFKVEDPLAGFVQDYTKIFVTTIRPRSPDVTEIPPIPFSFFDPEKKAYETVYSDPIPLTVNKSEVLSLDSIVSGANSPGDSSRQSAKTDLASKLAGPDFENKFSPQLLSNQRRGKQFDWKYFAIVPPLVWLVLFVGRSLIRLIGVMPDFRSTEARAVTRIKKSSAVTDIKNILIDFVAGRTKQTIESVQQAAGALRMRGLATEANEFESFIARLDRNRLPATQTLTGESAIDFQTQKQDAIEFVRKINSAIEGSKKAAVKSKRQPKKEALQKTITPLLLMTLACSQGLAGQDEIDVKVPTASAEQKLTKDQLERVFQQANESYRKASESAATDSAEAKVSFSNAALQYQTIADQGIRNSELFVNLANAQWQSNQPGRAIANYHRALRCDRSSVQAANNLKFAQTQISLRNKANRKDDEQENATLPGGAWSWLQFPLQAVGQNVITIVFACASVMFWGLVTLRTCWIRFPIAKWASLPFVVTLVTGVLLFVSDDQDAPIAIAVVNQLDVYAGDGYDFEINSEIESATGQQLTVLSQRDDWLQVLLPDSKPTNQKTGWVHQSQVETIINDKSFSL